MKWRLIAARRAFLFAAGVFLLALIVRLPASFVALALPGEIQIRNVEGSFWNGRASAVGVGGMLVQERLSWRFQPRALLDARLAWAVDGRLADQTSRLELAVGARGAALNEVSLALPLEPLAALDARLKPAQIGATLRVTAKRLSMDSPFAASIAVEHLFSPLVPVELGSYRLDCKGASGGKGEWQVVTVGGVLRVAGQGTFDAVQSRVDGRLTLTPQSPIPGLSPLLASLPRAGEGFLVSF
ncbi:MAG: type II secretion system protein N [Candidatus Accumulibacter sp.]|jgi:hypothetical protein|nr:type II secretion system protein N [Accumulibacter sp.]